MGRLEMAAYAALVSLLNTIKQIMNHPRFSASFEEKQIESLGEKVEFLLDFVESTHNTQGGGKEAEDLESQIASVIEYKVAGQIHAGYSLPHLQNLIAEMGFVKEQIMTIWDRRSVVSEKELQLLREAIAMTAYAADLAVEVIEPHIKNPIYAGSTEESVLHLQKVIADTNSIKENANGLFCKHDRVLEHFERAAAAEIVIQVYIEVQIGAGSTEESLLHLQKVIVDTNSIKKNATEIFFRQSVLSKEELEDLGRACAAAAHSAANVIQSHIENQIHAGSTEESLLHLQKVVVDMNSIKENVLDIRDKHSAISKEEVEDLGRATVAAAHAAADIIESQIHDVLDLQKVIIDMNSIKEKVMQVKEKWGSKEEQPTYSVTATSSRPLTTGKNTMVGFDDELVRLMDVLTRQQSGRQIISIVGMGGIGKTTLAQNVYENSLIMQYFHIRAWATISQEYSVREILLELLSCLGESMGETIDELGEQLYKSLIGRRYLIILDDIWSIEVWDSIKFFFPDTSNSGRVVLTTRQSNVAIDCGSSFFELNFLDKQKSWKLFCEKVFGQEDCPAELEKIGKEIARQCKGLPLSIVVIGGLLRKSHRTVEHWHNVAKDINSTLSSGENEQCLNVLFLSYSQLPAHLKPCFLRMGILERNHEISVSETIRLWVAEGFLKPNGAQILEKIGEVYLKDLVDRNLVLVGRYHPNGKIRYCHIHDLLRNLCFRVAEKENFPYAVRALGISQDRFRKHCLISHDFMSWHPSHQVFHELHRAPVAFSGVKQPIRLMRVLNSVTDRANQEDILWNVNLRYLGCIPRGGCRQRGASEVRLPSEISQTWNLQTLVLREASSLVVAPSEIWKMSQLRHLECDQIYLPDPPMSGQQDDFVVLRNLQTLSEVVNFKCSEEACKRIPNIEKLHIKYDKKSMGYDHCLYDSNLYNLGRLHKLESLTIKFFCRLPYSVYSLKQKNTFPSSLNWLSLTNCRLRWEDLTTIGSLAQLEVLELGKDSFMGYEWNPVDGEFLRLKYLRIGDCDLISWTADRSHFPVLEKLILVRMYILEEIPWGIGEIPTLELISLDWCTEAAVESAMQIKEERESLGNDGLQIRVKRLPPEMIGASLGINQHEEDY